MGDDQFSIKLTSNGRQRLIAILTAVINANLDVPDVDASQVDQLLNIVNATAPDPKVPAPGEGSDASPVLEESDAQEGALVAANIHIHVQGDIVINTDQPDAVTDKVAPGRIPGKRPKVDKAS